MGLEEVKQGLEKEMEAETSKILKEAEEEKARIFKEAEEEVKSFEKSLKEKTEAIIETIKKKELASANLNSKKILLNTKKEIIDEVFDKAMEKLMSLSSKDKKSIYKKLLSLAKKELDVKFVYCNKNDKTLFDNSVSVKVDDNIKGGIICENKDGSSRVDYTFYTLVSELREQHLKQLSDILF